LGLGTRGGGFGDVLSRQLDSAAGRRAKPYKRRERLVAGRMHQVCDPRWRIPVRRHRVRRSDRAL